MRRLLARAAEIYSLQAALHERAGDPAAAREVRRRSSRDPDLPPEGRAAFR